MIREGQSEETTSQYRYNDMKELIMGKVEHPGRGNSKYQSPKGGMSLCLRKSKETNVMGVV